MPDDNLSLRLLLWLFRTTTVPWPHFFLFIVEATLGIWLARSGEAAWAFTSAFGAAVFLATGLTSVWVRRKMGEAS